MSNDRGVYPNMRGQSLQELNALLLEAGHYAISADDPYAAQVLINECALQDLQTVLKQHEVVIGRLFAAMTGELELRIEAFETSERRTRRIVLAAAVVTGVGIVFSTLLLFLSLAIFFELWPTA